MESKSVKLDSLSLADREWGLPRLRGHSRPGHKCGKES